ncbi:MAG: zinc ribbon domain-containing protein [Euryarchaeota archaeon]|nr:zinc ribbon domain-containing protein [Euryarchaeota archaeon]
MKEKIDGIDISDIQEKITDTVNVDSVVGVGDKLKEMIDASSITEKVQDVTEKTKTSSVVTDIRKGISKISSGDRSILAFSKTCSKRYAEIGETVTVTIKLESRHKTGVLDCIVTDEIPPQFELIGEMPSMVYQLSPREAKEYQYTVRTAVGGHFRTRAMCEIENKFSLDDIPSNDMEIYVSPLGIRTLEVAVVQGQWKEIDFTFENLSNEEMTDITVSLKKDSKFDLDKVPNYSETLAPGMNVTIPLVIKTQESGSVSLNLNVACTDEHGEKCTTEKNFLVSVIESDKTVTKVDIGSIGEVVASGATQIKESVIQRSAVGGAAIEEGEGSEMLYAGSRSSVEVSGSIVQRSEMGGATGAGATTPEPEPEPEPKPESESEKVCPKCNNVVQAGWKMCPFCGTGLELKCPGCDRDVEEGWKMCPFCGGKLR